MEREEAERKRQEEAARREERRIRYNNEVQRTRGLVNAAKDYDTACMIRAYVAAIEKADNLDDNKRAWVEWAKQKADWYDPTVARNDDNFGKREHEKDSDSKVLKESYFAWKF